MALSHEARNKADFLVITALESDNVKKRREAAEAQLTFRLLNPFNLIDDKTEIDSNYITSAEYQIFLDEMREQNKFYQPDHWSDYQFPKGEALHPICGVRPEDAEAFCRWLNRRQGNNAFYRLPNFEEARQTVASTNGMAFWCKYLGEYKLIGLGKNEGKIIQQLAVLLKTPNPSINVLNFNTNVESDYSDYENPFVNRPNYWRPIFFVFLFIIIIVVSWPVDILALIMVLGLLGFFYLAKNFRTSKKQALVDAWTGMGCFIFVLPVLTIFLLIYYPFQALVSIALTGFGIFVVEIFPLMISSLKQFVKKNYSGNIDRESLMNREIITSAFDTLNIHKSILKHYEHYLTGVKRFWFRKSKITSRKQIMKDFNFLQVLIAREKRTLPSWEGIRLVRETKD